MPKKKQIDLPKIALIVLVVIFILGFAGLWFLFNSLTSIASPAPVIGKQVAVIEIKDNIGSGSATADEIIHLLDLAEENPSVAAVLLDIDSGGGLQWRPAKSEKK